MKVTELERFERVNGVVSRHVVDMVLVYNWFCEQRKPLKLSGRLTMSVALQAAWERAASAYWSGPLGPGPEFHAFQVDFDTSLPAPLTWFDRVDGPAILVDLESLAVVWQRS